LIVFGFVSFLIAVGLWFSLRLERTTSAVVGTVLVGLFLWALLPMAAGFLGEAFGSGEDAFELTISINPFVWMGTAGAGAVEVLSRPARAYWVPGMNDSVPAGPFTTILFAVCGGFFALAVGIVGSSIRRFNRLARRPS
jgi:hypothetical protein